MKKNIENVENISIKNFNYNCKEVRTKTINGNPYFCLIDICEILNIKRFRAERLNKDGVISNHIIDNLGRQQETNFINEPNLYRVIFESKKESAIQFQNWIFEEVLPTLRKTGKYEINPSTQKNITTYKLDSEGFYLLPPSYAVAPSRFRYKIINGTVYFKVSDIDSILGVSRRDGGDTRTATNYTIHHILGDIGITPYTFDYLINIWEILELCNHIKSKRAELFENIIIRKIKPYFEYHYDKQLKMLS